MEVMHRFRGEEGGRNSRGKGLICPSLSARRSPSDDRLRPLAPPERTHAVAILRTAAVPPELSTAKGGGEGQ
eukprot:2201158-Pyramimonas_sp.AAC.1